jgi:hypothetical protein
LGWHGSEADHLLFGHPFPEENTDIRLLKNKDKESPLDYYVAKWQFKDEALIGMPNSRIDFVFYVEGDQARRTYNKMLHEKYQPWLPGYYNIEQRYGL